MKGLNADKSKEMLKPIADKEKNLHIIDDFDEAVELAVQIA